MKKKEDYIIIFCSILKKFELNFIILFFVFIWVFIKKEKKRQNLHLIFYYYHDMNKIMT